MCATRPISTPLRVTFEPGSTTRPAAGRDHLEFGLLDEVSAVLLGQQEPEEDDDRQQHRSRQLVWRPVAVEGHFATLGYGRPPYCGSDEDPRGRVGGRGLAARRHRRDAGPQRDRRRGAPHGQDPGRAGAGGQRRGEGAAVRCRAVHLGTGPHPRQPAERGRDRSRAPGCCWPPDCWRCPTRLASGALQSSGSRAGEIADWLPIVPLVVLAEVRRLLHPVEPAVSQGEVRPAVDAPA